MNQIEFKQISVNKVEKFKKSLPNDHVIYTMLCEHEKISELLDKLFIVNQTIQKSENLIDVKADFENLNKIVNLIIKSDLHHQREEQVLFPELERMGVFGYPFIKKLEHENVNDYLDELQTITLKIEEITFAQGQKRIKTLVKFLILKLKENMDDENSSIYPKAVEVITEKETWEEMKRKCDQIGYFNFVTET